VTPVPVQLMTVARVVDCWTPSSFTRTW
jgi:hypothetical protein